MVRNIAVDTKMVLRGTKIGQVGTKIRLVCKKGPWGHAPQAEFFFGIVWS